MYGLNQKPMKYSITLILLLGATTLISQDYVRIEDNTIELNNGLLSRKIHFENGSFYATHLSMEGAERNYIQKSREFAFILNGAPVDGFSGWDLLKTKPIEDERSGRGVTVILSGRDSLEGLQLEISYMLYPQLPLVRKWLKFVNKGDRELNIEGVNVEDLQTAFSHVHTVVLHNYGRMKHIGSFTGTWHDPVVVLHHQSNRFGMAVGNEAPAIMKRTAYHTKNINLEAGLTHPGQDFPFRKWLNPLEEWESPKTFICLYRETEDGFAVIDETVNDFVRKHMVPQIIRREEKPVFVYNTWNPFRTFVSDSLVRDVARAAAECGIKEFIIDDGWQVNTNASTSQDAWGNNYGDWNVDEEKFPGGFSPTFDYIRSLGMKPGIWMSIGSATRDATVFKKHPEWFVKNKNNKPGNLHSEHDADFHTSCYGTDWVGYISDVIVSMFKRYGLAYTKLDFAIAASAYVNNPENSGCYATDHPYHKDHHESLLVIYERVLELFDRLHKECPGLFIDCTFETAGKLQLMDYAIANHADGNWLSNFEEPSPTGPLRVRQMAWWRSPALPASSLVIGNTPMDDPNFEFALKSLIGTFPIVLGDPRKIPSEERGRIKQWSNWMQEMQDKYDYMSYRRDLPGFGEPREGSWDGWMRINNDSRAGGIIGVFRQGALEDSRRIFVKGLKPESTYHIRQAPEGKDIVQLTGHQLMEQGFQVEIPDPYDAKIYEIGIGQ